ncbi:hypothetical protein LG943_11015 [Streptomonospora sp. S1-112]|uniref:Uncharacterized protein n=1 Tax=Streptomonospora mangrovi TaxID=2883123 RepID=A0A9X3NN62_9ACTN|nr:hypothetical protein [Streptomonospora mangrovi]MDA0564849.1 hypothetical protein [Streptomonospora mangrovi]
MSTLRTVASVRATGQEQALAQLGRWCSGLPLERSAKIMNAVRLGRSDFTSRVMAAARSVGLEPEGRLAARCAPGEGRVAPRSSFFASLETARLYCTGIAAHTIQHEDVLIFGNPTGEAP